MGSNLGDRHENLLRAIALIQKVAEVVRSSSVYETQAWGNTQQGDFLNQVIEVSFQESPQELLKKMLAIENEMGRSREIKWGPRTIDIDILFFGQIIVNEKDLIIPHQEIASRRFTLLPLAEIASTFIHPVLNKSCHQLSHLAEP